MSIFLGLSHWSSWSRQGGACRLVVFAFMLSHFVLFNPYFTHFAHHSLFTWVWQWRHRGRGWWWEISGCLFWPLFFLKWFNDVEDSVSEGCFFLLLVSLFLLLLEICGRLLSTSVSGSIDVAAGFIAASIFLLIALVNGILGKSATELISSSRLFISSRQIS